MNYSEEQTNEVALIQSVYPDETTVICDEYPNIQLKITLPSEPQFETPEPSFYVDLTISLPPKYPEEAPTFSLDGFTDDLSSAAQAELADKLTTAASSMPGFQVLITLVTELQYSLPIMLKKVRKEREDEADKIRTTKEEAELKKFEKNRVTVESFNKWREAFEREFFAAELEAKKAKEAAFANKLTGKQQFLRDSSLINSDLSMLDDILADDEEAEADEAVDVDKSLFADDLSDLDIDDEDTDEDYEPDASKD